MADTPTAVLTYCDGRGRATPIRLMLAAAGIKVLQHRGILDGGSYDKCIWKVFAQIKRLGVRHPHVL